MCHVRHYHPFFLAKYLYGAMLQYHHFIVTSQLEEKRNFVKLWIEQAIGGTVNACGIKLGECQVSQ